MSVWNLDQAFSWYNKQGWLVGCNFLPSSCINQIEMFQEDTFKLDEIVKPHIDKVPQQVGLNLPKLKKVGGSESPKMNLPKLKKVTSEATV